MPEPAQAVPLKRVVLGLNGSAADPLVVRIGCQLVRGQRADLIGVHVVEVDWSHELADDISSGNEVAAAVLDRAEGTAETLGTHLETSLLQARDVGAALVDEAAALGADVIVLGLPYRTRFGGDFAIGRTVPYVFQNAPCRVLVARERMPTEARPPLISEPVGVRA
ncbi:MAG: universal stress protein [Candidatus Limnocylindrales bacterium]